jgi:hypothetical protein
MKEAPVKQKKSRFHPDGIRASKIPLGRLGKLDKLARRVKDFFVRLVAERYLGTPVWLVGIGLMHNR